MEDGLILQEEIELDHFDIEQLLQRRPTALLLETRLALNVLRALNRLGLRVPADIAVVGFDDLPLAQKTEPTLTTMRQPMPAIAALLISILLDMIENGPQPPRQVVFEQELVIRQSCGAAQSDHRISRPDKLDA